jgi:uracil-DNA glycosylase family 4
MTAPVHQPHDRTMQLRRIQAEIRACRRCVDAGYIPVSAPILNGNASARIMVIGQAPGIGAAERPLPYSGATGRTLRGWLARAGFPDDAFHDPDRFYLTSLTKCFPGKARSGAGDRAPGRREIALCSSHLQQELALVQPDLILALGRLSIDTLLPAHRHCTLAELVGVPRSAELAAAAGAVVLPLPHPSGVSRWHNQPAHQERVEIALAWLAGERERRWW